MLRQTPRRRAPEPSQPGTAGTRSVRAGADHLTAGAGRERLPDPGLRGAEVAREIERVVEREPYREPVGGEGPGRDRLLDEPHRAVGKGDVHTAGMPARR